MEIQAGFGSPRLIVENKCVRADDCRLCVCVYVCVREGLFQCADISTSSLLTANRRAVVDERAKKKGKKKKRTTPGKPSTTSATAGILLPPLKIHHRPLTFHFLGRLIMSHGKCAAQREPK